MFTIIWFPSSSLWSMIVQVPGSLRQGPILGCRLAKHWKMSFSTHSFFSVSHGLLKKCVSLFETLLAMDHSCLLPITHHLQLPTHQKESPVNGMQHWMPPTPTILIMMKTRLLDKRRMPWITLFNQGE